MKNKNKNLSFDSTPLERILVDKIMDAIIATKTLARDADLSLPEGMSGERMMVRVFCDCLAATIIAAETFDKLAATPIGDEVKVWLANAVDYWRARDQEAAEARRAMTANGDELLKKLFGSQ